ncbi:hypothetical protein TrCOL_g10151 [Triparma columacea]|uniref:Photosystem II Psb31 protein domain-containing protein n=1 Tax=Triparma columacea TaxID=722753 RepID=A0A9W7GC99_9STRA|nr:hypothetical protein TrCOL_g10151 [Triparma columacea]
MKLAIFLTLFTASTAFSPTFTTPSRTSTSLNVARRDVLTTAFTTSATFAAAGLTFTSPALADGAVSTQTKNRARGIYGSRIANLKDAVSAGDFGAVVAEKNAFILFNSGALKGDKAKTTEAIGATNNIFAAIRAQDKPGLKKAYEEYVKAFEIGGLPNLVEESGNSQGYSNDYDYRARTKAGTIYVR